MKNNQQDNASNDNNALNSFIEKYGNAKDDPGKSRIISLWEREQKIKTEQTEILRKELEYLKIEVSRLKLEKNRAFSEGKSEKKIETNIKIIKIIAFIALACAILAIILIVIFVLIYKFVL